MDAGFCWSDGWSWNASMLPAGWLLPAVLVIVGAVIVLGSILLEVSSAAHAKRRGDSGVSVRTSSRSSMWSWDD